MATPPPGHIKKNRRDMIYMRGKKVINVSKKAKKSRFQLVRKEAKNAEGEGLERNFFATPWEIIAAP